jgi:succinate dehydrogenase/fumarate reductase cytochrome b subunit
LWLILLALGTGIGLSSVSRSSNMGASVSTISIGAIVWLIVTQVIATMIGGQLLAFS